MSAADFVVCGGGIGGAVLAEQLARSGKRVVVLERNLGPPTFLRPEVLWPASIDVLCTLRPREIWEREVALPVRGIRALEGREEFAHFTPQVFERSGVQPWFVNPNAARELLLTAPAFELRRGVEVIAVLREGERITGVRARDRASGAESDVPALMTIGDDGEHSIVRAGAGIRLETRPFPLDFLCFGIEWPAFLEPAVARIWLDPAARSTGIMGLMAMPFVRGQGAGLVIVRAETFDANRDLQGAWRAFLEFDPAMRAIVADRELPGGMVRVKRRFGHSLRYGAPGAFLLGDAAHPVTPVGGQGANMAIADARVLAPLLIAGARDALRIYERTRMDANARSVGFSRGATRLLSLPGGAPAGLAFGVARTLLRRERFLALLLRTLSRSFLERS